MKARIHVMSVFVDDQAKALKFYTEMLGSCRRPTSPSASTAG